MKLHAGGVGRGVADWWGVAEATLGDVASVA
jgi:hypothetical protein